MKKTIISIIISFAVVTVAAQTNQYPGATGTISRTGYSYKYRNGIIAGVEVANRIELYNAACTTYLDVKRAHKDGSKLSEGEALGYHKDSYYFGYSSMTYDQLRALVDGCFTPQQMNSLKSSTMIIDARLDPMTGKVVDVYFSFRRDYPLVNIPVETFRSIELAIKQQLTITATAAGKKFNYLEFMWQQKF